MVLSRMSRGAAYWGEGRGVGEGAEEVDGGLAAELYWYRCIRDGDAIERGV